MILHYIEPFIERSIASIHTEDEVTFYFDADGELLAEANCHDGAFISVMFYERDLLQAVISKEQAEAIAKKVQAVFALEGLALESLEHMEDEYVASFIMLEPVYNLPVLGSGMRVTMSTTGFVQEVTLLDNDFSIEYPEKLISKEEARLIIKQHPLLKLGIAPAHDWQYVYMRNYDVYGVTPDGKVKLFSDEESMQDASFEPLSEVESIEHFEPFLTGGRQEQIEEDHTSEMKHWSIWHEDGPVLASDAFTRACQVVKYLAGTAYRNYYVEQYPTLKRLLNLDEDSHVTYRFVYIYEGIPFDFQAIAVTVEKSTNQILLVTFSPIPYEQLKQLPKPKLSLEEANAIAHQLVDVELSLERDLQDYSKFKLVYDLDFPTSPSKGHIQFVDAFTGEVHWVETGWYSY